MSATRVARRLLAPVLFASILVAAAGTAGAVTATSTALPAGFRAVVVDATTGRVFVSSPSSNTISVLSAQGTPLASLVDAGPGEMLARNGKLYVASTTAGRIDLFDTTTLQQLPALTQGLVSPGPLAWADGLLWTTTGSCGSSSVRLVSIDPGTGAATVQPQLPLSYCPDLVASPTQAVLVGYDLGLSPTTFYRIDVSTGIAIVTTSYRSNSSNTKQIAFLPSGDRVVVASGYPYELVELDATNLQPTGVVYPIGPYPIAAAIDPDGGLLAAGADSPYGTGVEVYPVDNPVGQWSTGFGSYDTLWDRGLAWSPDGQYLYAVSGQEYGSGSAELNVFSFAGEATTTTVQASATDTTWSQPVSFTASVTTASGASPTGSVTFLSDGSAFATADLVGGAATVQGVNLPAGTHEVTASYSGDGTYAKSGSAPIAVTVSPATTATALTGSPLDQAGTVRTDYGQPATFDAAVTVNETGLPAPSGEVEFLDGTQVLATVPVADGEATLTEYDLPVGNHTISAEYVATSSAAGSSSPALRAHIDSADSQTALSQSSSQSLPGQTVTFTAVVSSAIASPVVPTGSVTFYDGDPLLGAQALGTASLTNGGATLAVTFIVPGQHTVYAVYSGDGGYRSSRASIVHDVLVA